MNKKTFYSAICLLSLQMSMFAQDVDLCCNYTMDGSTFPCCGTTGNCTWWAAYKCREMNTVCASKDAKDWYTTAQNGKVEVGNLPAKNAVVCFTGNHVAYVEDKKASTIVISEMLCDAGVNCMRQREISISSSTIIGYIYPAVNNVTEWDFKDRTLGWRIRSNAVTADFFGGDWWRLNPTGKQPQVYSPYSQTPIAAGYKYLEIRYSIKGTGETVPCRAYFDTGTGFNEKILSVQSIVRNNTPQTVTFAIPAIAAGNVIRVMIDLFDASVYQDAQISINNISYKSSSTGIVNAANLGSNCSSANKTITYDILGRKVKLSSLVSNSIVFAKDQKGLVHAKFYQPSEKAITQRKETR